jgi:hypothetical protein
MMVYAAKRKSDKPAINQANAKILMIYAALGPHWPIMIFQMNSFAVPHTDKPFHRTLHVSEQPMPAQIDAPAGNALMVYAAIGAHWPIMIFQLNSFAVLRH